MSISGADPTGAAGIHADLRTFTALRVHGLAAVAAVTAQNSRHVIATRATATPLLRDQIRALAEDFEIASIKIGLLASASNISVVSAFLRALRLKNVVLDPVLVSSSGDALMPETARRALLRLLPLANLLTPNRPEAAALLGRTLPPRHAARALLDQGAGAVLLKGGHSRGSVVVDYFADAGGIREIRHPRLPFDARGTGCVLASAVAAYLARGFNMNKAVDSAEEFLQHALRNSRTAGRSSKRFLIPAADNK